MKITYNFIGGMGKIGKTVGKDQKQKQGPLLAGTFVVSFIGKK